VLPLEAAAGLTAATIGAVIIALHEPAEKKNRCATSGNRPA